MVLSAEEQSLVDTVHDFVEKQVKPVARELEHANTYPEELIETMKEIGIFGLAIPEPYGVGQVSMPCYVTVTEELARGWMSLAGAMGGHTVVSKLITMFGTEEQKQRYLPRMATGELRTTMALTEPGGGSDLQAMRTVARRDGDEYVINGSKTWITNARRAGLVALLCKTDPTAEPAHRGVSILLVEKVPGFAVSKDLPKLGYKGVESCELNFTDCRVPADALLGAAEGSGFAQMMKGLEVGGCRSRRGRPGSRGPRSRTRCVTPRSARASASPSGSTSRWATCSPTWAPNCRRPGRCCSPPQRNSIPARASTWRPGWPSCSPRKWGWRSPWTRCGCTAGTAIPPSTTSSGTSGTRR